MRCCAPGKFWVRLSGMIPLWIQIWSVCFKAAKFSSKFSRYLTPFCNSKYLKGVWHEIFDFRIFSWISVPQAPNYSIGAVLNFFKNSRRYLRMNIYAGVNCSAMSTTPAKIFSINPCHREITKKPKVFRRCQRHCRKTVHRCQQHRR